MLDTIINTLPAAALDEYLHSLKDRVRANELVRTKTNGKTPLHLAIDIEDIDKVELLLNYGAPLEVSINEQSLEDYALQNSHTNNGKKIYALICTRKAWSLSSTHNALLADTYRIIKNISKFNMHGTDKPSLLVVGVTGEGKSTFINFLNGVEYVRKRSHGRWVLEPTTSASTEIARVGHSTTSETSMPEIHDISSELPSVIELPGFEDTRGYFAELSAAVGMQLLLNKIRDIQGIVLVCSQASLENPRMLEFRQSAIAVGAMASQDPSILENITLVITKTKDDLCEEDVREILTTLLEDEGLSPASGQSAAQTEVSTDIYRKQCLGLTLTNILSQQNNIVIGDVTSADTRTQFWELANPEDCTTTPAANFDFSHYSYSLYQFKSHLHHLLNSYQALYDQQASAIAQVEKLSQQQAQLKESKNMLCEQIKVLRSPISETELISFEKEIKEIKFQLDTIAYEQEVLNINREALREEYQDQNNLLSNAEQACASVHYSEATRLAGLGDHILLNDYRVRQQRVTTYTQNLSRLENELKVMDQSVITLNDSLQEQTTLLVAAQLKHEQAGELIAQKRQIQTDEVSRLEKKLEGLELLIQTLTREKFCAENAADLISDQIGVNINCINTAFDVATLLGEDVSMPGIHSSHPQLNLNHVGDIENARHYSLPYDSSFFSSSFGAQDHRELISNSYHQPS